MSRSRLSSERAYNSDREEAQAARTSRNLKFPLAIVIGILSIGGVWFFQQTSLRHLHERTHQLQQDIDKLPTSTITPIDRIGLEKDQILLERDRINAQNGVYNLLFQGISTIILGGFIYTGWQYLRRTDEQFQHTNDKLISDRFSQAIAYLASEKMEVRLGGIYSLERLAEDSPSEYWLTIEILTAFVRERSALPLTEFPEQPLTIVGGTSSPASSRRSQPLPIPTDIQAVMTILSRRDVSMDRPDRIIELRESNLRDADLNGIELWGADLWKVNLREAQLWQAKLAGASLGRANLSEASLWQADLEGAYLWKANLEGANLTEANLDQANLEGSKDRKSVV